MWFDELLSREPLGRDKNNLIFSSGGSPEWQRRQDESVDRYADEHYEEDPRDGQQFGNFIAAGLRSRDAVVLDIGSGIAPELPHYVAQLGLTRFLALEPLTTPVDRAYPCLVGATAEDIPLKDGSVGAVLFATSLNHIEREDAAIAEVGRVLKHGGSIYFWEGMHDAELLAEAKSFGNIVNRGGRMRALRMAFPQADLAMLLYRMRERRRKLAKGEPLDNVHFRWNTRKSFAESLARWGLITVRELQPQGMTAVFVEATAGR